MDHFGGGSATHPVLACAADMSESVKAVAEVDPGFMSLSDRRSALLALSQMSDQVEALKLRVVAGSEQVAEADGARSVADWLADRSRRDRPECARTQQLATALGGRPAVAAGLAEGRVNLPQAEVIVRALDRLGPQVRPGLVAGAEQVLVEHCAEFAPRELKRLGERVLELVDPEVFDDQERRRLEAELERAQAETRLSIRNRGDGTVDVAARVPEVVGARLRTYLEAFTSPRRDLVGSGIGLVDVATGRRIPHERLLGEAFCALLEAIDPAGLPVRGGSATQVVVTIDLDRLTTGPGVGTLADGTPITTAPTTRPTWSSGCRTATSGSTSGRDGGGAHSGAGPAGPRGSSVPGGRWRHLDQQAGRATRLA